MDKGAIRSGISRSWNLVLELEIGETISDPMPLEVNTEFRDIALDKTSTYTDIYVAGLRLSHYNFSLSDYSYFQFSWTSLNHVRYAYYPNPFRTITKNLAGLGSLQTLTAEGLITFEEYLAYLGDADPDIRVPPIRYENAPDQHSGLQHPCSHLHFGHHLENRWAINRVLTPTAFTLMIIKHYYVAQWRERDDETDECKNTLDARLLTEKIECPLLPPELFLDVEKRGFSFS